MSCVCFNHSDPVTVEDQDELMTRLTERDSVNTPWDKPANPNAEKLLWGDKKITMAEACEVLKYRV